MYKEVNQHLELLAKTDIIYMSTFNSKIQYKVHSFICEWNCKRGLPHTYNLSTLNVRLVKAIDFISRNCLMASALCGF